MSFERFNRRVAFDEAEFLKQVVVPTASVLTLNATPVEIVPAPGLANRFLVLDSFTISLDFNTAAYTVVGVTDLAIKYTDGSGLQVSESITIGGFLDGVADEQRYAQRIQTTIEPAANAPLVLHAEGADPAVGDSPLIVKLYYRILRSVL